MDLTIPGMSNTNTFLNVFATYLIRLSGSGKATSPTYLLQLHEEVRQWDAETGISPVGERRLDAWLVGRQALLYRLIEVGQVEKKLRAKALEQQVRRMSPFQNTGSYVYPYLDSGAFSVWVWDEGVRLALLADLVERLAVSSEVLSRLPVYPEPCLKRKKDEQDSVIRCGHGYEQQQWVSKRLVSSRWLPPEALDADGCEILAFETAPWGSEELDWIDRLDERSLLPAVAGILLVVMLFPVGQLLGWEMKRAALGNEIREEQSRLAQVIAKRDKAVELQASSGELKAIVGGSSQLRTMKIFDEAVTSTSLTILEWEYQQGKLAVKITDKELDNRSYVEELSAVNGFGDVRVDPGVRPTEAVITITIGELP